MSQKSSVPQAFSFVSQVLKRDTFLPKERSIRWKVIAIAGLLLAFSIDAAIMAWYYPAAR